MSGGEVLTALDAHALGGSLGLDRCPAAHFCPQLTQNDSGQSCGLRSLPQMQAVGLGRKLAREVHDALFRRGAWQAGLDRPWPPPGTAKVLAKRWPRELFPAAPG